MNTVNHSEDNSTGKLVKDISTDGAKHVAIQSGLYPVTQPITENVYSDTATGSRITEGGLEDYSYFQFQVVGALAAEDLIISISLDGINFVVIPVINMATGAEIAAGTNIEAAGMYRYGNEPTSTSLRDAPTGMGVKAIKVERATATTSAQVDVTMRAS